MGKPNKNNQKNRAAHAKEQQASKEGSVVVDGTIRDNLSNGRFNVELDENGRVVIAHISGKIRTHYIRILPGDRVQVELSPYDLTRGRIIYRHR